MDKQYKFINTIFAYRKVFLSIFLCLTFFFLYHVFSIKTEQNYDFSLPSNHSIIKNYFEHRENFGNTNKLLIALSVKKGTILTEDYMNALKTITDEVYYLPTIDRTKIMSLFTPNVRFIEVVEDGFTGGNVIPHNFTPDPENFGIVKENILKSSYIGFLVSEDFKSSLISAELLPTDTPDYILLSQKLEEIRNIYENKNLKIHIIGFPKFIGDLHDGNTSIMFFFFIAMSLTMIFLIFYTQSIKISAILLICSFSALIWQFGILSLLNCKITLYSILLPFLIFAIAISHGVQILSQFLKIQKRINSSYDAALLCQKNLIIPGSIALLTDCLGFLSIHIISIPILQNLAISASIGIACILITNILIFPLLLSFINPKEKQYFNKTSLFLTQLMQKINYRSLLEKRTITVLAIVFMLGLSFMGIKATQVPIGDQHNGIPEFYPDSPYNQDMQYINKHYNIGINSLQVYIHATENACIDYETLKEIESFDTYLSKNENVYGSLSLPKYMKATTMAWNENYPKWYGLSRNKHVLVRSMSQLQTSSGLMNENCSIMPITVYTQDHKYETAQSLLKDVKTYQDLSNARMISIKAGGGNLALIGATNQTIENAQFLILIGMLTIMFFICSFYFKSIAASLSILLPLMFISFATNVLMGALDIGLKISTLPIAALGIGIGIDYGIYLFSHFQQFLKEGISFEDAYLKTINTTGKAIIFTAFTLSISTLIWIFSPLKFQADMGILLSFMFFGNMITALVFIPIFYKIFSSISFRLKRSRNITSQKAL